MPLEVPDAPARHPSRCCFLLPACQTGQSWPLAPASLPCLASHQALHMHALTSVSQDKATETGVADPVEFASIIAVAAAAVQCDHAAHAVSLLTMMFSPGMSGLQPRLYHQYCHCHQSKLHKQAGHMSYLCRRRSADVAGSAVLQAGQG